METAGRLVDDEELREAMKDSGIGTPATRAAIIERLLAVGYIERDARALVVTEKGLNVVRLLDGHQLTSPSLTGDWEHRLAKIETGEDSRRGVHGRHRQVRRGDRRRRSTRSSETSASRARTSARAPSAGTTSSRTARATPAGRARIPGCGFVIWKAKAGKTLTAAIVRELIRTGRTERAVTGFRGRSGRSFRARLALEQTDEGRWRVEFDEPWAREGAKPPEAEADARRGRRRAPTAPPPPAESAVA